LIQGGDVITDCSTFLVAGFEETREGFEDSAQAAENTCERLGYPSGDFTVGNSEIVLSSGADVPGGELPDTGGLPLGGVAAGVGMLLVASGLLVRRRLS
jgi:LPXTG-motif cell wall-anchored protein